jgi:electron transfer flavoprotein alpha subunit
MAGIWIFGEDYQQSLELLNIGRSLAQELDTHVVSFALNRIMAQDYLDHGSDEVMLLPALPKNQPFEAYVSVLAEQARQDDPDLILITGTKRGNEIGARVAARLNTGLCTGCIGLQVNDNREILMKKMVYGGLGVQTVVCSSRPAMAAVASGVFEPAKLAVDKGSQIIRKANNIPYSQVRVVKRVIEQSDEVAIRDAKVVVCVGRGLEKQKDIELAQELARILGGTVACSRPVAIDLKWMPKNQYVGISGIQIKPDLYIGIGVSGQPQHVCGICDSKVIVAINRDADAPFFEAADYGIVGDLYDVVPALINEIKARSGLADVSATGNN